MLAVAEAIDDQLFPVEGLQKLGDEERIAQGLFLDESRERPRGLSASTCSESAIRGSDVGFGQPGQGSTQPGASCSPQTGDHGLQGVGGVHLVVPVGADEQEMTQIFPGSPGEFQGRRVARSAHCRSSRNRTRGCSSLHKAWTKRWNADRKRCWASPPELGHWGLGTEQVFEVGDDGGRRRRRCRPPP